MPNPAGIPNRLNQELADATVTVAMHGSQEEAFTVRTVVVVSLLSPCLPGLLALGVSRRFPGGLWLPPAVFGQLRSG